jgi:hypothetical protein
MPVDGARPGTDAPRWSSRRHDRHGHDGTRAATPTTILGFWSAAPRGPAGTALAAWRRQEERTVINRLFTGSRCKNVRPIAHPAGAIDRHTQGTIRYGLENLGRDLMLVDWDTGKASMVFPSDIELLVPAQASAS